MADTHKWDRQTAIALFDHAYQVDTDKDTVLQSEYELGAFYTDDVQRPCNGHKASINLLVTDAFNLPDTEDGKKERKRLVDHFGACAWYYQNYIEVIQWKEATGKNPRTARGCRSQYKAHLKKAKKDATKRHQEYMKQAHGIESNTETVTTFSLQASLDRAIELLTEAHKETDGFNHTDETKGKLATIADLITKMVPVEMADAA